MYWKSPRGDIGIIKGREDEPREMQKKERLVNIIKSRIGKEERLVRQKYMLNHPVVHLLERNLKRIDVNELFLNEKSFDNLKEFDGIAENGEEETDTSTHKKRKPHKTALDGFDSMTVKPNMNLRRKIGLSPHPTAFS